MRSVGLRRLLVNRYEQATDNELRRVAAQYDGRVFPKVRVADILPIENSGISSEEYRYALQAHFDFVVGSASGEPFFAVEFDESYHRVSRSAQRRDGMKDALCTRFGLPLLRIEAQDLERRDRFTALGWLAEGWFLYQIFEQAQGDGRIAHDEGFSPIFFLGPDGGLGYYSIGWEAKCLIRSAWKKGICGFGVEHIIQSPWLATEETIAYALLGLGSSHPVTNTSTQGFLIGQATCKVRDLFPGCTRDLVEGLSEQAVGVKLRRYLRGEIGPDSPEQLAEIRHRTAGPPWHRVGFLLDRQH